MNHPLLCRRWIPFGMRFFLATFLWMGPGLLLAQTGEPALWIAPANDSQTPEVLKRIHHRLTERGAVIDEEDAALPPGSDARIAITRIAIRDGVDALFEPNIAQAIQVLEQAYALLSSHPDLLVAEALPPATTRKGMLHLVRAHLQNNNKEQAIIVVDWILRTWPSLAPSPADFPRAVVALVQERQGMERKETATVDWPLPDPGCRIRVNGVERKERQLVPGDYILQMQCGESVSPLVRLQAKSGDVHPIASRMLWTPTAENKSGGVSWLTTMPTAAHEERTRALARHLRRPVATAFIENRTQGNPIIQVFRYETSGQRTVLATTAGFVSDPPPPEVNPFEPIPTTTFQTESRLWTWILLGSGAVMLTTASVLHGVHNNYVEDIGALPNADQVDNAYAFRTSSISLYASGGAAVVAAIIFYFIESDPTQDLLSGSSPHNGLFSTSW